MPEDLVPPIDRFPQFSVGVQFPVNTVDGELGLWNTCIPIECVTYHHIIDWAGARHDAHTGNIVPPLKTPGVCVNSSNPRGYRGYADVRMSTMTWGVGGPHYVSNYWDGLDASAGDYVGFAFAITGAGFMKIACVFEQGGRLCNRGLNRVEPKTWLGLHDRLRQICAVDRTLGEFVNDDTIFYVVSLGTLTEVPFATQDAYKHAGELPTFKEGRTVNVKITIDIQDMWLKSNTQGAGHRYYQIQAVDTKYDPAAGVVPVEISVVPANQYDNPTFLPYNDAVSWDAGNQPPLIQGIGLAAYPAQLDLAGIHLPTPAFHAHFDVANQVALDVYLAAGNQTFKKHPEIFNGERE